jgi:hypothetical protein
MLCFPHQSNRKTEIVMVESYETTKELLVQEYGI